MRCPIPGTRMPFFLRPSTKAAGSKDLQENVGGLKATRRAGHK
jgi:hypothetical protein